MNLGDYKETDRVLLALLLRTRETDDCTDAVARLLCERGWVSLLMKRRRGRKGKPYIAGFYITRAGARELALFDSVRKRARG